MALYKANKILLYKDKRLIIMNLKLNYYTKSVFGNELRYLADSEASNRWLRISGKKTIDNADMIQLTALTGVEFIRVFEPSK